MNEYDRRLMLQVIDDGDVHRIAPIVHGLYNYTRYREIFHWIINNRMQGNMLWTLYCDNHWSPFQLALYILRRVEKDRSKNKILLGIDYRA